ncbi:MAG: ECF transporter S component [Phascolarctobacterium sp.]|nr:ECF transporter S component [Phascolarctobacterium sp.]
MTSNIAHQNSSSVSTSVLCVTALFMALNIMLSSFGLPVPGGHLYLNDIVICTAAILLDNYFCSFAVGGVGAFLGDLFFYPTPMFVSLVTHGIQAIVITYCANKLLGKRCFKGALIGVILGAIIMVVGYSLGRAFIYSTPHYAYIKLPYQILQACVGAFFGVMLTYKAGILEAYDRYFRK